MENYTVLSDPDEFGCVEIRRADGKVGRVQQAWLKASGDGAAFVPFCRTKAIRIKYFTEWKQGETK